MSELTDLKQIGLSGKAKLSLERLKNDGYFAEQRDAYKFAVGLCLAREIMPPELPPGGTTIYNTQTIDEDGSLAVAIKMLMPADVPPYRWAERLAEAGITILAELADSGKLDPSEIIRQTQLTLAERVD
ncbi:MAG: hypothetical protein JWL63_2181 [Rhodocyclales bacterium]|nr:hypothetical protein [Rhodocyclales bacterium]